LQRGQGGGGGGGLGILISRPADSLKQVQVVLVVRYLLQVLILRHDVLLLVEEFFALEIIISGKEGKKLVLSNRLFRQEEGLSDRRSEPLVGRG